MDRAYEDRELIRDCLKTIGLDKIANAAIKPETPARIIDAFIAIIENEAIATKRHDVLEQLYFAGLSYGQGGL